MKSSQQILFIRKAIIGIFLVLSFSMANVSCARRSTESDYDYYSKGVECAIKGEFKKAKEDFLRALGINSFYTFAKLSLEVIEDGLAEKIKRETMIYLFKAVAYLNKNMLDEAIVESDKAILSDPDYAGAYQNRGGIYYF